MSAGDARGGRLADPAAECIVAMLCLSGLPTAFAWLALRCFPCTGSSCGEAGTTGLALGSPSGRRCGDTECAAATAARRALLASTLGRRTDKPESLLDGKAEPEEEE